MSREIGRRVFAIRSVEGDIVYAFGAGVYAGDFLRPGVGPPPSPGTDQYEMYKDVIFGASSREFRVSILAILDAELASGQITQEQYDENKRRVAESDAREAAMSEQECVTALWESTMKNPRIDLDNGKTTWGLECWWGPEDTVKARYPEPEYTYTYVDSTL